MFHQLFSSLFILSWFTLASTLSSDVKQKPQYQLLPSLRQQAEIQNTWRDERTANIPNILSKYGVDAWLMSQREYAEDTVFWSLKCATQFSARRRTIHLFFSSAYKEQGMETAYKWIDNTEAVFEELAAILKKHDPKTIALNTNDTIAFSSGLRLGAYGELVDELGLLDGASGLTLDRFTENPMIAVEYVATMSHSQLTWYKRLQETTWALISEAFSSSVITPGETTTTDVEWWLREKVQALNYSTWFQPDVTIVTANGDFGPVMPGVQCKGSGSMPKVISEGDMLHVDFGVTALGLNTDTQHLAYVARAGETEEDVPQGLKDGLKKVNRLQDIVRENMIIGKTGNEILNASLAQMHAEGIGGRIYCHPIGDWGHSAGTVIGMTNLQEGVPVLGDLPLLANTYYSVELYAEHFVPERNATINFYQEEDVYWDRETKSWEWVYGRQEEYHFVGYGKEESGDGLVVQDL